MKKRYGILLILIYLAIQPELMAIKLSEKTISKIEKTARKCFERKQLRFELLPIEENNSGGPSWEFDDNSLYRIYSDSLLLGYLVVDQAMGRYDPFDFMILYRSDLEILKIEILKYRSAHGAEIASARWLQRFEGSSRNDQRSFLAIDALSGATFSSNGLINAVFKIDESMWSLFGREEYGLGER